MKYNIIAEGIDISNFGLELRSGTRISINNIDETKITTNNIKMLEKQFIEITEDAGLKYNKIDIFLEESED